MWVGQKSSWRGNCIAVHLLEWEWKHHTHHPAEIVVHSSLQEYQYTLKHEDIAYIHHSGTVLRYSIHAHPPVAKRELLAAVAYIVDVSIALSCLCLRELATIISS